MLANRSGRVLALAAVALLGAALGGCDTHYRHQYPMDPAFGNATKHNMAAQTVDPDPAWAKDTDLTFEGAKIKKGTDRYYGGEIIKPEAVITGK